MKRICLTLLLFSFVFFVYSKQSDKIYVKVNDEIILESEINETVDLLATQIKLSGKSADLDKIKKEVINNMIDQKLIITMAANENINISDEAVADHVNEFIDSLRKKFPSEAEFEEALAQEGMSYADFRMKIEAQVRDNLLFTKVKQKKQQDFISKSAVSDEEIEKFYDKNKDLFKINDEINLKHLFFDKNNEAINNLKTYVNDIYNSILSGKSFEKVAEELKYEKGVRVVDLGWVDTTQLDKNIRTAVYGLKKNAVTKPIETEDGYLILKVVDVKKGEVQPLSEIKEKVRVKIIEEKVEKMWDEWLAKIKKDAYIKYM
ncbi:MAG TPA: peptidyl-prolyl cis-trans isomerase [Candidatus Goldiibacteriota bacterium]|nr:peptidyl-prolyl cis-trans isomerase [Candidatus Goldiibacteriota bacterium]